MYINIFDSIKKTAAVSFLAFSLYHNRGGSCKMLVQRPARDIHHHPLSSRWHMTALEEQPSERYLQSEKPKSEQSIIQDV